PDNNVQLRWDAPTDDHAPAGQGLRYNLRIGTTPGGSEIMSPQAHLPTGQRLIPNEGNAGLQTNWLLINPPPGTYYWSVQAIDPALAGSAFSEESTFVITNSLPTISPVPRVTAPPNGPPTVIAFTVGDLETPTGELLVAARSSNTNLLPNENLVLGGAGADRRLTITPLPDRLAESVISLTVTDAGGLGVTRTFVFDVDQFTLAATFPTTNVSVG